MPGPPPPPPPPAAAMSNNRRVWVAVWEEGESMSEVFSLVGGTSERILTAMMSDGCAIKQMVDPEARAVYQGPSLGPFISRGRFMNPPPASRGGRVSPIVIVDDDEPPHSPDNHRGYRRPSMSDLDNLDILDGMSPADYFGMFLQSQVIADDDDHVFANGGGNGHHHGVAAVAAVSTAILPTPPPSPASSPPRM